MRRRSDPREGKNSRGRWRPLGGPGEGIPQPALSCQPPSINQNAPCGHSGGAGGRSGGRAPPGCGKLQKAAGEASRRPQAASPVFAPDGPALGVLSPRPSGRSAASRLCRRRRKIHLPSLPVGRARTTTGLGRCRKYNGGLWQRKPEEAGGGRYPRPSGVSPRNPPSFFRREKSLRVPPSGRAPQSSGDLIPPTPPPVYRYLSILAIRTQCL